MFRLLAGRPGAALRLSPVIATGLLTSAIFLLPATTDHRQAQASPDEITNVSSYMSGNGPYLRR